MLSAESSGALVWAAGVLGLLVGSFLNVLIHRLPIMLERQWSADCAEHLEQPTSGATTPFNLWVPRSACPHCGHQIRWYENIPVLSFLWLRGRCSACHAPIRWRYPMIELVTALTYAWVTTQWGWSMSAVAWGVFATLLLALAVIDWDTTLLPDDLTLPLLWLGLIAAAMEWTTVGLEQALWGAVCGYLSLWTVFWAFKLATGKDGMGYGDFKLFAALGAWLGWTALIPIILMASVFGAVVGIALKLNARLREGGYVPFGPFLALGGATAVVLTPQGMLALVGL